MYVCHPLLIKRLEMKPFAGFCSMLASIKALWSLFFKSHSKQECFPVGCVPPALCGTGEEDPRTETSWKEQGTRDRGSPRPRGQIDTCEDITLPQTSFAGGNEGLCLNSGYTLCCWAPDNLFLYWHWIKCFWLNSGSKVSVENQGSQIEISKFFHFKVEWFLKLRIQGNSSSTVTDGHEIKSL